MKTPLRSSTIFCGLLLLTGCAGWHQGVQSEGPLVIASQGNFFVGGENVATDAGTIFADAMYVQYQIPAEQTQPYPIVFIHGGASSGSYFWSAPDGREGWATQFLRMGYAVYVVDRPTLGRSPWFEAVDGPRLAPPTGMPPANPDAAPQALVKQATRGSGSGAPDDPVRLQQASQAQSSVEVPFGAPGDALAISTRVDRIDQAAGAVLLDRIGPAILLTHSRAGTTGWLIADARPDLVKAVIAVEPNGPPFFNAPPIGRPGDPIARPFGITYAPMTFAPAITAPADFGELREVPAPDGYKYGCWLTQAPYHRLTNLTMPVMMVSGGASYHAAYDYCTAAFLEQAGVPVDHVQLDQIGIEGNTHGMMGETNNGELAKMIADWIADHVD